ncbi:MAG: hypothetical protein P8X48_06020 [Acidiferrobacteraceae bacterium]
MTNRVRAYSKLAIGVFGLIGIVSTAYGRSADLVDPAPQTLSCSLSDAQMVKGITGGLMARGWYVTSKKPGVIGAEIIVRGNHTLDVEIKYTNKSFDINYKSSKNLNYSANGGKPRIHPNANSWMMNINNDIGSQLNYMCVSK